MKICMNTGFPSRVYAREISFASVDENGPGRSVMQFWKSDFSPNPQLGDTLNQDAFLECSIAPIACAHQHLQLQIESISCLRNGSDGSASVIFLKSQKKFF